MNIVDMIKIATTVLPSDCVIQDSSNLILYASYPTKEDVVNPELYEGITFIGLHGLALNKIREKHKTGFTVITYPNWYLLVPDSGIEKYQTIKPIKPPKD